MAIRRSSTRPLHISQLAAFRTENVLRSSSKFLVLQSTVDSALGKHDHSVTSRLAIRLPDSTTYLVDKTMSPRALHGMHDYVAGVGMEVEMRTKMAAGTTELPRRQGPPSSEK